MKRNDCDNKSSDLLGTLCWIPLFVLESLSFEPMHQSSQKSNRCPMKLSVALLVIHEFFINC